MIPKVKTEDRKIKKIIQEILKKIPIFIFCVLFISGYNWLCGTENNIVGVVLLMGILILIGVDLGYDARQASFSIVLLFLILAFAPKISLLNPWIGLPVNIIALTLIMVLSAHDLSEAGHLPFTMGYIMLQGYDVTSTAFQKRWISLLIGGAVVGLLYFLTHHKKTYKRSIQNLWKENRLCSTRTQWYIQLIATECVVMFVGDLVDFPKTMWICLTILSLNTPLEAEYKSRIKLRIPATIIGSVLVFALFESFIPAKYQTMLILFAGFLSMFIISYFIKTIYNSFSALITAALLFPANEAISLRITANLIGAIIAVFSIIIFSKAFQIIEKQLSAKQVVPRS